MFGILVSAFNVGLGFLLRGVVIKFVILSAIFYVISYLATSVLTSFDITPLTGLQLPVDSMPNGLLWFMFVMKLDFGVPLVLGAYLTRFLIRRLPFIG